MVARDRLGRRITEKNRKRDRKRNKRKPKPRVKAFHSNSKMGQKLARMREVPVDFEEESSGSYESGDLSLDLLPEQMEIVEKIRAGWSAKTRRERAGEDERRPVDAPEVRLGWESQGGLWAFPDDDSRGAP